MVLAVDIGNSYIVFGAFKEETLLFSSKIKTDYLRTDSEYAILLSNVFALYSADPANIMGGAIASVVPTLTAVVSRAIKILCNKPPIVVAPGIKTGLDIKIDDPQSLAADICSTAVATIEKYPLPAIIIDLGTATKITAVDANSRYIGGAIAPGVILSLEALAKGSALLPQIGLCTKIKPIATETTAAMRSGTILGTASMLDGMIDRFEKELGEVKTVIACGDMAETIIPYCLHTITIDPNLMLDGLYAIFKKNQ